MTDFRKFNNKLAIEQLFNEHYSALCKKAYRLLNNKHLSEDVVQDVFVKLCKNKSKTNIQNTKNYLSKMVYNECISQLRKQNPENTQDTDFFNNFENLPNQSSLSDEVFKQIHSAINELPTKCKAIFVMSKFENMTYQQIAEELDLSIKTVENQMSKAFKTLRSLIKSKQVLFMLYFNH